MLSEVFAAPEQVREVGFILQELADGTGCPEVRQVPGGRAEHAREQINGGVKSS